ncbi:ATP-binding protein [Microbacterium sp. cx-55]|uniref:sensor histidine kinase n=1 Tax=Microbacterium sp. cx-55 TaxID=2875948 RepID=UPI001CBBBCA2|nr:ATP-binding protein [Microbacterium sp. cx-55]MBZ4487504.1 GHKL domain-containing protein [Microbacterium sp. cx-55]UGB35524.1 ATP-binding protein [Microbacterium sp. cx-55]
MAVSPRQKSAASRVFFAFVGSVLAITALLVAVLAFQVQTTERSTAEQLTLAVARTIAEMPEVASAVTTGTDADATASLQPIAERIMAETPIDFVTIMTTEGIRLTHRDPAEIGKPYIGTIGPGREGRTLTEEAEGTLGPSLRSVVPIEQDGRVVALVSAGITLGSVGAGVLRQVPFVVVIAIALAAVGLCAAWIAGRFTRRIAGDLPASAVRDAVSSYESVRTLGEALHAQRHEHANRMHTAVALIELGRGDDAIDLLTETARTSQALADHVVAREGDPTVAALLLGKSAQAAERGIDWTVEMQPAIPRTALGAVDAVSLVGNLVDNAIDAAASGSEPRWVRVEMAQTPDGRIALTFIDSGDGVPPALRERIFEHGFSTKPAGADGRGVGLALVRAIVDAAGGSLELSAHPTTFRIILPAEESA